MKRLRNNNRWVRSVLASLVLLLAYKGRADEPLILTFPQDRSVGQLWLRDADFLIEDWLAASDGWTKWAVARGTLRIPPGKAVRLDLARSGAVDPRFLQELPANALVMLNAERQNIDDELLESIRHLTELRILKIDYNPLTDDGLSQLACLGHLEVLDLDDTLAGQKDAPWLERTHRLKLAAFRRTQFTDMALRRLGRLRTITSLDFSNTPVTDENLVDLAELASLQTLNLSKTKITNDGLRSLTTLRNLTSLDLSATLITDDGLSALEGMGRLQSIDLRDVRIHGPGLAFLSNLPELRTLQFQGHLDDVGLQFLGKLTRLEQVVLEDCRATDAGMRELAEMKQLRSFVLDAHEVTDDGLSVLAQWPELESLKLDDCRLTAPGLERLAATLPLKSLKLSGTPIADEGLKVIGKMQSLEELGLFGRLEISWEGLGPISQCSRLKRLDLYGQRFSGSPSLAPLGHLENLEKLSLFCSELAPEELLHLSKLTHLKVLNLNVPFADAHAEYLGRLPSLETLYLNHEGHNLTADGLRHVARLNQLRSLEIRNHIIDDDLLALAGLKSLRWLDVSRSENVTSEGIVRLVQKLPELSHVFTSNGDFFDMPGTDINSQRLVGQMAPDFQVELLDGDSFQLSELRGKVVILYFWGPWCGPCVKKTAEREALFKELLQKHLNLVVLSLSQDENEQATRKHLAQHDVHSLQSVIPFASRIADDYFVQGAGWYLLIDPQGRVAARPNDLNEVRDEVEKEFDAP